MAEPSTGSDRTSALFEEQLNKLVSLVVDQEIEISTVQEQVETSSSRLTQVEECDRTLTRTCPVTTNTR